MWYWKQTRWNNYRLRGPDGSIQDFVEYGALYKWCRARAINAVLA